MSEDSGRSSSGSGGTIVLWIIALVLALIVLNAIISLIQTVIEAIFALILMIVVIFAVWFGVLILVGVFLGILHAFGHSPAQSERDSLDRVIEVEPVDRSSNGWQREVKDVHARVVNSVAEATAGIFGKSEDS